MRYQRITELGWNVNILKQATAVVVGAGALGNEVLKNLALLGIGKIWLCDMDIIEEHNLTRTALFRSYDIGKFKAIIAAERVKEINPDVQITAFTVRVQNVFGQGIIKKADVVFGCVDNIQTRIDINRLCYQTNTLYIDGGLRRLDGDVKIFASPYSVCLDCTLSDEIRSEAWKRHTCLKLRHQPINDTPTLPTAPTIAAIIAGLQVQIAIKFLHGITQSNNYRLSVFGNIDEFNTSQMTFNPYCPTHLQYDKIPIQQIIELPFKTNELTLLQLLKVIEKSFNIKATIDLGFDLITNYTCHEHKIEKQLFKRRGDIFIDEAICELCVAENKPLNDCIMQEYFINSIDGTEDFYTLNKTINEIGIPFCPIFQAKCLLNNTIEYKYYELTGDRGNFC